MSEPDREDAGGIEPAATTGDIVGWRWARAPQAATAPGSPAAPEPAGETSERYRPLRLVGKGGMGEVMLCSDGVTRREVARSRGRQVAGRQVVLEQLGVLAPSYAVTSDGFVVLHDLTRLPLGPTQVLLTGMCLLTIVLCSLSLSRLPQRLLAAERQQALHAWQMRLLVDENQAGAAERRPAP